MIRRSCQNTVMFVIETLRFPLLNRSSARTLIVEWENLDVLTAAVERGQGVALVGAHLGNYDLLTAALSVAGIPMHVIYRDIHNQRAHDFWRQLRCGVGLTPIPPRRSKEQVVNALSRGEVVAFASDQHMPQHRGIVCEFLGQLASTSPAPARFAYETGAQIVCAVIHRDEIDPTQLRIRIEPPFELESPYDNQAANLRHNTERLNRIMERWIRAYPEQWLWHHKRFKVQHAPSQWDVPDHLRHLTEGSPKS